MTNKRQTFLSRLIQSTNLSASIVGYFRFVFVSRLVVVETSDSEVLTVWLLEEQNSASSILPPALVSSNTASKQTRLINLYQIFHYRFYNQFFGLWNFWLLHVLGKKLWVASLFAFCLLVARNSFRFLYMYICLSYKMMKLKNCTKLARREVFQFQTLLSYRKQYHIIIDDVIFSAKTMTLFTRY